MTLSDLNAAIANLTTAETAAVGDCTAAFNRLKTQLQLMNLAAGSVVAGGVLSAPALSAFDLPIAFLPGPGQIASLQFDLPLPSGFSFVSATPGPVAIAAQKSVSTSIVAGALRVLVFGINQTVLGQGLLLTVRLSTDATVAKRLYSISMTGIIGSNPAGTSVVLSGVSGSITIT